jgi:iron(III) transport system permease protein
MGREPVRAPAPSWRPTPWLASSLFIVLVAGALPLAWLGVIAARDAAALAGEFVSPRALRLLLNTMLLAGLVALLSGTVGTLLGVLIARTDLPLRAALAGVLTFPLFLPPYIVALAWFTVFGWDGFLAALGPSAALGGSRFFFGLGGAVLVLTTAYTPVAAHLTRIALRSIDPSLEDVARLTFPWRRVLWRIDGPLIAPAVALAMLLTFVLVVGELGVPAYLRYAVFSTEVFAQFAAFLNIRAAVAMSLPLGCLVLVGLGVERYLLRSRVRFLVAGRPVNRAVIPLGRWRPFVGGVAWTYAGLTVILPLIGLVVRAGGGANYVAALNGAGASLVRSVWMAAAAATAMAVLGFLLGYIVERARRSWHEALDTLLLMLFAAPGTVLGVGLILLWNRAGLAWVYGSAAIVLVGWVGHFTPITARIAGLGLRSLAPSIEEAARLAGVRWSRTVWRVLVPLSWPALAGSWCLGFVFCLRDLDLAVTIYPPGTETLSVRVYTLMANSPEPVTAALAVVMVGLTSVVLSGASLGLASLKAGSRTWS